MTGEWAISDDDFCDDGTLRMASHVWPSIDVGEVRTFSYCGKPLQLVCVSVDRGAEDEVVFRNLMPCDHEWINVTTIADRARGNTVYLCSKCPAHKTVIEQDGQTLAIVDPRAHRLKRAAE